MLTTRKRAGVMPITPATTGTTARIGATKRASTTLFAPCLAKYFLPAASAPGCARNGHICAILSA
jgi:hypothetical protein